MIDFTESMQMQEANAYNYQKSAFLITFSKLIDGFSM
jgi:hypothetical protein